MLIDNNGNIFAAVIRTQSIYTTRGEHGPVRFFDKTGNLNIINRSDFDIASSEI